MTDLESRIEMGRRLLVMVERSCRWLRVTPLVAGLALAALTTTGCGVGDVDKTANAFMTDLKTGNTAGAYALETSDLQKGFGGSAAAMAAQIQAHGQQPVEWSFNSVNVTNGVGQIHGSATFVGGVKGVVDMEMVNQNGKWAIAGVKFAK